MKPMKTQMLVSYYDIESDKAVEKTCFSFDYDTNGDRFEFVPVDDPVKSYKAVVIDHPRVYTGWNNNRFRMVVEGYQYTNSGGYWKTKTVITLKVDED